MLLTGRLWQLPDLESQLAEIIRIFEHTFSCSASCWLADSCFNLVRINILDEHRVQLVNLSELMTEAQNEKRVAFNKITDTLDDSPPTSIAVPLVIREEVLGVIQLARLNKVVFTNEEVDFAQDLALQSSIALDWRRQQKRYLDQEKSNIQQILSSQIIKSIVSNLDLNNLLNSTVTLIYHNFKFSKVSLAIDLEPSQKKLLRLGISKLGIEPPAVYSYEHEESPINRAILHHEMIVINNTGFDTRFSSSIFDNDTKSELVLPMMSGSTIIGVLDLCSDVVNAFSDADNEIYVHIANLVCIAIRNSKVIQSEKSRRILGEHFIDVIERISVDFSFEDILDKLLDVIGAELPYDAAGLWLLDNPIKSGDNSQLPAKLRLAILKINDLIDEGDLQLQSIRPDDIGDHLRQYEAASSSFIVSFPWLSEVLKSNVPIVNNSLELLEPIGKALSFPPGYSSIGIPLHRSDQILGLIILVHHLPYQYSIDSQLVASTVSNFASITIENARSFSTIQDQTWLSSVLLQVAEAANSIDSLNELFDTIADQYATMVGLQACSFYLLDQSSDAFYYQASYGFSDDQQSRLNEWIISSEVLTTFDEFVLFKNPLILNADNLSEEKLGLLFPDHDFQSNLLILFPLINKEIMIGTVLIDFTGTQLKINSPQKIWDDIYTSIQGINQQVANAIVNVQNNKSREEEAYISVALLQVAQAIVSLNQLDEILGLIVRITPLLVGVKRCIIYLWDTENLVFRATHYYGFTKNEIDFEGKTFRTNEFQFIETVFKQNKIVCYQLGSNISPSDWSEISEGDTLLIEKAEFENSDRFIFTVDPVLLNYRDHLLIGLPISIVNEVLGVMLIEEDDAAKGLHSAHIREKRIEIVNGITQQAAIAIKNDFLKQEAVKSERMERELQLAREIQQAFLPDHVPTIQGWDIDIRWQPAREVGGDFYDIIELDEDHIGFVIADVADKGMPAALFMTLIRTLLRAAAKENNSPADVLKQVNNLLILDAKNGMFVTVFYAVINIKSGDVTYANAGHNPPIIKYPNTYEITELTRTSMALGVFTDIEVNEGKIFLHTGDVLFFYTDGVTEAFSPTEEMYGIDRLNALIKEHQCSSSKELLDEVESSIRNFISDIPISDDLTIAVFKKVDM